MHIVIDEIKVGDEVVNQYGEEGVVTAMYQDEPATLIVNRCYRSKGLNPNDTWTKRAVRGSG